MKKSLKYLLVLFITLTFGIINANADEYVCKSTNITCVFDTGVGGGAKCTDTNNKKYSDQNFNSQATNDVIKAALQGFRALDLLNESGKCPKYFVYSPKNAMIYFMNDDTYTFSLYEDGEDKKYEWSFSELLAWINNGNPRESHHDYVYEIPSLSGKTEDNTCDSELTKLKNLMDAAKSKIDSTDCSSIAYDYCDAYYTNYKTAIDNANAGYKKYINSSCDMKLFKTQIESHEKDYKIYISLDRITPRTTANTYKVTKEKKTAASIGNIGDNICSENRVLASLKVVGIFLFIAKIFVPIIIIAVGSIDLYKTINKGDQSEIVKAAKSVGIRIVIGVAIFFLPSIIYAILLGINNFSSISSEYKACEECLVYPTKCQVSTVD